jgi:hypothetical protein
MHRTSAATLVVLATIMTAACSSHDSPPGLAPAANTGATPTSNQRSADAPIAAYRGMWNAYVDAAKTSDPDAPALREYATGNALKLIVGALVTDRAQGKIILGSLALTPRVTLLTPTTAATTAAITDCVDSTHWLEHKKSGGLWDDKPGGKHRTTASVEVVDGVWKVTAFTLRAAGTC